MDWNREQLRRNVESASAWELYSPHRRHVTRLLIDANSQPGGSLCLLGAGNLNDVDLAELLTVYRSIVLVDLDADAVRQGVARQGLADHDSIQVVVPVDVTGLMAVVSTRDPAIPVSEELCDLCARTLEAPPRLPLVGRFDVVGSVGLLTQLIETVSRLVGESHPRYWPLIEALRRQHVRLLLDLTVSGGAALLVTEVVSSDSLPALLTTNDAGLRNLLPQAINSRNFFTGTNPAAWQRFLQTDPVVAPNLATVTFTPPWLWPFVARTYAVFGVLLRIRP